MTTRVTCIWVTSITLLLLLLSGCKSQASNPSDLNDNPKVVEASDPTVIQVQHPEQFPLVTVDVRNARDELKVTGVVSPDVSLSVPVNAMVGGRVAEIRVRLGDFVHKGDVLLTINSPDLALTFQDYQKFKADEALAKTQLDRAQLLLDHGALAMKDLEVAQGTYNKALVDTRTTAERIRLLGGDPDHISTMFEIRAPASGVITEQNAAPAAGVKTLDNQVNLFTISDLSRVWVLCDVYENNLGQVRIGEQAQVELNAFPGRIFRGRVGNISSLLDPNTRSAKVRIELPNPASANSNTMLRPGMFASVTFYAIGSTKHVVVPATAVLRLHDKDWVFEPRDGNRFRRVEVRTGAVTPDGFQQVITGLDPGTKVVKNALQFSNAADNNS